MPGPLYRARTTTIRATILRTTVHLLATIPLLSAPAGAADTIFFSADGTDPSCGREGALVSTPPGDPTEYTIRNETSSMLVVYWLDYEGDRQRWFDVPPAATATQGTFTTHPWLVADATGRCLGTFAAPAEIVVQAGEAGGNGTSIGVLEVPQPGSSKSGIGIISGWYCDARQIQVQIDESIRFDAGYGTSRADTLGVCGDTNNGFGLLINWNNLGDGPHEVRVLADGVELGKAGVVVSTFGTEFLRGAAGGCTVGGFPHEGQSVQLRWDEGAQGFAPDAGQQALPPGWSDPAGRGVLEIPAHDSVQSGIGVVSGWRCDATSVTIVFDEQHVVEAAYGTSRADTAAICGDTNNGFSALLNWSLLGPGLHTARALADGVEFHRSSFRVSTYGTAFLHGADGSCRVTDFPVAGRETTLTWEESSQRFVPQAVLGRVSAELRPLNDAPTSYAVANPYGEYAVSGDGRFAAMVSTVRPTLTTAVSSARNRLFAHFSGWREEHFAIDEHSTAEALVLINPLLASELGRALEQTVLVVRSDPEVRQLGEVLRMVYEDSPDPLADARLEDALTSALVSVLSQLTASATRAPVGGAAAFLASTAESSAPRLTIAEFDMGALTTASSSGSTLRLDVASVGKFGLDIKTNVSWIVDIVELETSVPGFRGDPLFFFSRLGNIYGSVKHNGDRTRLVLPGAIAGGWIQLAIDPIGVLVSTIAGRQERSFTPSHEGVYAVLAYSGGWRNDEAELNAVWSSGPEGDAWIDALALNLAIAGLDVVGAVLPYAKAGDAEALANVLPALIAVEKNYLKGEMLARSIGVATIETALKRIIAGLYDSLQPLLHSGASTVERSLFKKFLHIGINTIGRISTTFTGFVKAGSRVVNLLKDVTPREAAIVAYGVAATPRPTARPTPQPTGSAAPSPTPTPGLTPHPTAHPTAHPTPAPTATAAPQTPSPTGAPVCVPGSQPPLPYEESGHCPFECCVYGAWCAEERVVVYDAPFVGAPAVGVVDVGDEVQATTGFVRTIQAGVADFSHGAIDSSCVREGIAPGACLSVLNYRGEGYFLAWDGSRALECEMYSQVVRWPVTEWWVLVHRGDLSGWVLDPDGFAGQDACSGDPPGCPAQSSSR
ncbi:MAG: hypothetical protein AB1689_12325 [Thermodesulfobacteriota bacterium]